MIHAIRNANGSIQSLFREPQPGSETLDEYSAEVQQFFYAGSTGPAFNAADADFVRVIEDLIDTLIMKNLIRHTDLPDAAQRKLLLRKGLRNRMQGALNLLDDNDKIF
jgi:hypothetical protein